MGVQKGTTYYYVDNDPSLKTPLQKVEDENVKSFADGELFDWTSGFDFEFASFGTWNGPCLYLKASVSYASRDAKCDKELSFFCEWRGISKGFL